MMWLACAAAGYSALSLPWYIATMTGATSATNPIDGLQIVSIPLLFAVGIAVGWADPRKFWLWGLCTMAAMPPIAIVEIILDPTSHNLWPLEFFFYALLTLPGILGAKAGSLVRFRSIARRAYNAQTGDSDDSSGSDPQGPEAGD